MFCKAVVGKNLVCNKGAKNHCRPQLRFARATMLHFAPSLHKIAITLRYLDASADNNTWLVFFVSMCFSSGCERRPPPPTPQSNSSRLKMSGREKEYN